ncbi:MAG: FGGY-family carbohydrate kinase [Armatimonadota bacterium]
MHILIQIGLIYFRDVVSEKGFPETSKGQNYSIGSYPLARIGERLPFINASVEGFAIGSPRDNGELYAAYLQGVGFVERWCYELMQELGAEVGDTIYTTGGGAKAPHGCRSAPTSWADMWSAPNHLNARLEQRWWQHRVPYTATSRRRSRR